MNKLQLYIAKSLRGYKSLVNFNPAEDVRRHIHDLRQALEAIEYDPLEKNIFYLLSYIEEGYLLSILRTIPTEPLDHLAATIFVPLRMDIAPEELDEVVRAITRKMSAPGMSADDVAELRRLFAREYAVRPQQQVGAIVASAPDAGYARALYGGTTRRTLASYLGRHIYQPEWLPYSGVFLLDADLGLEGPAPDLTAQPLVTTVPLLPPENTKEGFEPHIYGRPFTRPYAVPLGGVVDITWTRNGFEDRVSTVTVDEAGTTPDAGGTADSRKTLSPASFVVTSRADHNPIPDCTITVNGTPLDGPRSFTESELASARVTVTCPGYAPFSAHIDLAGSTIAHIRLDASGKVYRFLLPLRSAELGAPVPFELRSKQPITQSPIEGYQALDTIREGAGRSNMLAYAPPAAGLGKAIIGAVAGLVVGLVLGFCIFAGGSDEKVGRREPADTMAVEAPAAPQPAAAGTPAPAPAPEAQAAEQPAPAQQAADEPLSAAIAYLDGNRTWNRAELARFPDLAGLFDDMNSLDIDKLISAWGPRLKDSKNFAAVVRAAEGSKRKKINVHRDNRTTYNKPGDDAIGYVGYTYWIDP